MAAPRPVVVVGAGETAEIADEYLRLDAGREVVAFAAERGHLGDEGDRLGRPVVALDELAERFAPERHDAFVAVSFTQLNRVRERLLATAMRLGYRCPAYVSSRAFVWRTAEVGPNAFVLEGVTVQQHARVGAGVTVWSGAQVAHRAQLGDHCFLASHAVISGFCRVGERAFVGAGAVLADERVVGADAVVGAGAVVVRDVPAGEVHVGNPARATGRDAAEVLGG